MKVGRKVCLEMLLGKFLFMQLKKKEPAFQFPIYVIKYFHFTCLDIKYFTLITGVYNFYNCQRVYIMKSGLPNMVGNRKKFGPPPPPWIIRSPPDQKGLLKLNERPI